MTSSPADARMPPDAPFILMYHRVGVRSCDPWGLMVSPRNLSEQLEALTGERVVVPLSWLADELQAGRLPRGVAALTFDDGYADVLLNGKPILEKHGCPATMFLATGFLGSARGFWSDVLATVILEAGPLPEVLHIKIGESIRTWRVLNPEGHAGQIDSPDAVCPADLHLALWRDLKGVDDEARWSILQELSAWSGASSAPRPSDRMMTMEEAARLSVPGFIDFGAHSVTHPSFPLVSDAEKQRQIEESRRVCAELSGISPRGFAYPFGDLDEASAEAVAAADFRFACTTVGESVNLRHNPFRLPRLTAVDCDGDEFARSILARRTP